MLFPYIEITCPGVPDLENGERDYDTAPLENGNYAFEVEARYICENDFTLQGVTTRHCDGDGTSVNGSFDDTAPICDLIGTILYNHLLLALSTVLHR